MAAASPWWMPDVHADRRPRLAARARIKTAIRGWFESQGFTEIETACLQISPGNERHIHAFKTELIGTDGARNPLYLHTSPEFACKKLLAAGEERIFILSPVFRNRERGALHSPEFTMLEWYRAGESYEVLMADCTALLKLAAETAGNRFFSYREHTCDMFALPERIPVATAFRRYAGIDLLSTVSPAGPDRDRLTELAEAAGLTVAADDGWSDVFSKVLTALVEPRLGVGRPTLLMDYPVSEAALARPKESDHRLAERFELYVCGIEIANGFGELTDPIVQRWRLETEMEEKERIYAERYPIDEEFIAAVAQMPTSSGVAVGFDRLVMLATGAERVDQVMWTPVGESEP